MTLFLILILYVIFFIESQGLYESQFIIFVI